MPQIFHFTAYLFIYGHKACGILVPRPGLKLASSALEGGFLTTGSPGKSSFHLKYIVSWVITETAADSKRTGSVMTDPGSGTSLPLAGT